MAKASALTMMRMRAASLIQSIRHASCPPPEMLNALELSGIMGWQDLAEKGQVPGLAASGEKGALPPLGIPGSNP
jgi:hypothetical protein